MNIVVVGTGYVGLVSGTCLAEVGHTVTCVDIDEDKIKRLEQGEIPIYEPGLPALVRNNVREGRLTFTTKLADVLNNAEAAFIAVGTPSGDDGSADMQYVYAVAEEIGKNLNKYMVVVNKSTVPVGTGKKVEEIIAEHYDGEFAVVSCPEFLREGSAVSDFSNPDRIVIGARDDKSAKLMLDIFAPVKGEKVVTTVESAELIKYASNAFLATKISFINEIAHICERAGADIEEVAYGIGLDERIGPSFLKAGIGWGGSCFPKDVKALDHIGNSHGYDFRLLKSVIEVNNNQRQMMVDKLLEYCGGDCADKTVAVLGLAFKGDTDDIRESAAIDIIKQLQAAGAKVRAFDYEATENAKREIEGELYYAEDPYDAAAGADLLLLATEWKQFIDLDWQKMKEVMTTPVVFDGRNLLKPERMRDEYGFEYFAVGRNNASPAPLVNND